MQPPKLSSNLAGEFWGLHTRRSSTPKYTRPLGKGTRTQLDNGNHTQSVAKAITNGQLERYPSALPTTMMEKVKSPALTVSVQSCSPSLATDGAVAPAGGGSSDNTAGCGEPEALRLILTRSSKAGLAAGSGSAASGVNRAKSRCGATPEWAPSTGNKL